MALEELELDKENLSTDSFLSMIANVAENFNRLLINPDIGVDENIKILTQINEALSSFNNIKSSYITENITQARAQLDDIALQFNDLSTFKGEAGYTPIKGTDYFDGDNGYTPIKGTDYYDGEDGNDFDHTLLNIKNVNNKIVDLDGNSLTKAVYGYLLLSSSFSGVGVVPFDTWGLNVSDSTPLNYGVSFFSDGGFSILDDGVYEVDFNFMSLREITSSDLGQYHLAVNGSINSSNGTSYGAKIANYHNRISFTYIAKLSIGDDITILSNNSNSSISGGTYSFLSIKKIGDI